MAIENGLMSSRRGEVWSEGLCMGRVYGVGGRGRERSPEYTEKEKTGVEEIKGIVVAFRIGD